MCTDALPYHNRQWLEQWLSSLAREMWHSEPVPVCTSVSLFGILFFSNYLN